MDLVMDMATVDTGQVIFVVAEVEVVDPKHERHLLTVVHANCLMTYSWCGGWRIWFGDPVCGDCDEAGSDTHVGNWLRY